MKRQGNAFVLISFCSVALAWSCGTAGNGVAVEKPTVVDEASVPEQTAKEPEQTTKEPESQNHNIKKLRTEKQSEIITESGGACTVDADCVAASCCHPKACVDKARIPECVDVMCTLNCIGGTMDCGAGNCVCLDGQCAVHWNPSRVPNASQLK